MNDDITPDILEQLQTLGATEEQYREYKRCTAEAVRLLNEFMHGPEIKGLLEKAHPFAECLFVDVTMSFYEATLSSISPFGKLQMISQTLHDLGAKKVDIHAVSDEVKEFFDEQADEIEGLKGRLN